MFLSVIATTTLERGNLTREENLGHHSSPGVPSSQLSIDAIIIAEVHRLFTLNKAVGYSRSYSATLTMVTLIITALGLGKC